MPRLFVLGGADVGRVIQFEGGSLGRSPDCAAVLRHASVSRVHARVERTQEGWEVVDLDSRNGLSVDGRRVPRHTLEDGAEFTLGDLDLRFRLDEAGSTPAQEQEQNYDDEIELEEHDEGPELAPGATLVASSPPPQAAPAPPTSGQEAREELLRELGGVRSAGPLRSDVSQHPLWMRALIYGAALAMAALVSWGAFQAMLVLRGSV